jgi:hypothetical protein
MPPDLCPTPHVNPDGYDCPTEYKQKPFPNCVNGFGNVCRGLPIREWWLNPVMVPVGQEVDMPMIGIQYDQNLYNEKPTGKHLARTHALG